MKMKKELCAKDHDEIVYDGSVCPLCKALKNIEELEGEKDDLQIRVSDLEAEME